jgi:hypothetical protein
MSDSYWRKIAAPIIAKVIQEVGTEDERALKRALREAYPFGQRSLWPYKVWRHEVRRQLSGDSQIIRRKLEQQRIDLEAAGQLSLFC